MAITARWLGSPLRCSLALKDTLMQEAVQPTTASAQIREVQPGEAASEPVPREEDAVASAIAEGEYTSEGQQVVVEEDSEEEEEEDDVDVTTPGVMFRCASCVHPC